MSSSRTIVPWPFPGPLHRMDQAPIVRLRLLGPALAADGQREELLVDERPVHVLLLAALTPGWLARTAVAENIWPDLPREIALRNLRKTLHKLRAQWWGAAVEVEPGRLRLCAQTDLALFASRLDAGEPIEALALVQGPLAHGLAADGGDASTAWLGQARERWLGCWRQALLAALPRLSPASGEEELVRLRRWDPHDEDLARAHLSLLAVGGRRSEFERVRLELATRLADDLGVDLPASLRETPAPPPHAQDSGFIGRDDELAQLVDWLDGPAALATVTGLGGIGKTRLAAEAALRISQRGVAVTWLRLSDLADMGAVWPRLAALLGADLQPARDALPVLAAALTGRATLLVVDNAEHLLPDGLAPALEALRRAVPTLRMLVTSRELPTLPGERCLVLHGLEAPDPADPPGAVLRSDAARLFVARALRIDAAFDARAAAAAIGRIARAAEGHPLAIEQAASWVRSAQPEEIAAEFEAGQLPEASGGFDIEAVFARTWDRLAPPQRTALLALAALPASFDRAAALAIAGLRAAEFAALVDKSLIDASGRRWRLHPLWRAWLMRTQAQAFDSGAAVARRAALHYVACIEALALTHGRDGQATLALADVEWPHLAAAWRLALARGDATMLESLATFFECYLELRGRRDEALAMFAAALPMLPPGTERPRLKLLIDRARAALMYRAARYDDAGALAATLATQARALDARRVLTGALRVGALVRWQRGEVNAARTQLDEARAVALDNGFDDLLPDLALNLAILEHYAGRRDAAESGYRQAVEQARRGRSKRLLANALINLGSLLHPQGRVQEARIALEEAAQLAEAEGLRSFRTHALTNLGGVMVQLGDLDALDRVIDAARRSLAEGGEPSQAYTIELLALTSCLQRRQLHAGWSHLAAAVAAATRHGQKPARHGLPMYGAQLLMAAGERMRAASWLVFQAGLDPIWEDDRAEARRLLEAMALDAAELAQAQAAAARLELEQVLAEIGTAAAR